MAISIGKLALYTAGGGIDPATTLPVSLDVGTDNEELLANELYIGWRERRCRGAAYDELVEEFVEAMQSLFPGVLIQWEDFRKDNALAILDRYRQRVPSFNDDIQGTGAVALAGVLAAGRISGRSLDEERVVIYGAGAAGLGIARQIRAGIEALGTRTAGPTIAVLDSRGLLVRDRDLGDDYKRELAWSPADAAAVGLAGDERDLAAVIRRFAPTVLIGSSGQARAFDETIVGTMASAVDRPVILPFSNPTELSEARPADVLRWTDGRALVATGSPFGPVDCGGRTIHIGQGNNVFVFPGLGIGALASAATEVTDGMIGRAAQALADSVTAGELDRGQLFPAIGRLRDVTLDVAAAVIEGALADGVARSSPPEPIRRTVAESMWAPRYRRYVRA